MLFFNKLKIYLFSILFFYPICQVEVGMLRYQKPT